MIAPGQHAPNINDVRGKKNVHLKTDGVQEVSGLEPKDIFFSQGRWVEDRESLSQAVM